MKAVCPNNCESQRFVTTIHVVQEVEVDGNGEFVDEIQTLEVTHGPDSDNIWSCFECGAEAIVK